MDNLLQQIQIINHSDTRQKGKIKHLLSDIIALAFLPWPQTQMIV
jgi:hypothetical protein